MLSASYLYMDDAMKILFYKLEQWGALPSNSFIPYSGYKKALLLSCSPLPFTYLWQLQAEAGR